MSVNAPDHAGRELITKPLTFTGSALHLNLTTSAAGTIRVELQNADGTPITGYGQESCHDLFGDNDDRVVSWTTGRDVSSLSEKPVRIGVELREADLYSFRFAGPSS